MQTIKRSTHNLKNDINWIVSTSLYFALWFVSSIGQLTKYLGVPLSALASILAFVALLAFSRWVQRGEIWSASNIPDWSIALFWLICVGLFLVLRPLAHSGLIGPGSDREDALNKALRALAHGQFPYYTKTYLGNTISDLPGGFLLAAPFYLLGNSSLQNPFCLAFFLKFCKRWFHNRMSGLFYVSLFFLASPAALGDFVVGGDYTTNIMYVAVAIGLAAYYVDEGSSRSLRVLSWMFLGIALCIRPIYFVCLPVLVAFANQRRGPLFACTLALTTAATSLALVLPFYFYDPNSFTPLNDLDKLYDVPSGIAPTITLPILGLATSCVGFFLRLDRTNIFGIAAMALCPLIATQLAFAVWREGWNADVLDQFGYATAISMIAGLYLVKRSNRFSTNRSDQEHPGARV